jgi:nicotinamide phosphoribosyltransferase
MKTHLSILEKTDSYKVTHRNQYPPGTTNVYSNFESRSTPWASNVTVPLYRFQLDELEGAVVTQDAIDKMAALSAAHFGNPALFNRAGWEHILKDHGGRLPLRIKAVPEGMPVPTRNVMMTVENTCPKCFWVTNYLETLLVQMWYPTTVATLSRECKRMISGFLRETGGDPAGLVFKLHDFGVRGASSMESAAIGGSAHLMNFWGTDNIPALRLLLDTYPSDPCAGFSIPAAEHSTITSWGRENEVEAYRNMLEQFPTGLVAVVSDSYDLFNACRNLWGKTLKSRVLERDGTLVIRPDSGDPATTVLQTAEILGEAFGTEVNERGFKVLNPHVRIIQGDGVNYDAITKILATLRSQGWSADNLAFGMGGALLQQSHRDTLGFAFKASSIIRNGERFDFNKEPATDSGKASKKGRFKLVWAEGSHRKVPTTVADTDPRPDILQTVFEDGVVMRNQTWADVRQLAELR